MHQSVQNLISIQASIKSKLSNSIDKERIPKIIAVSKTFKIDHILPLIYYGHFVPFKIFEGVSSKINIFIYNNI